MSELPLAEAGWSVPLNQGPLATGEEADREALGNFAAPLGGRPENGRNIQPGGGEYLPCFLHFTAKLSLDSDIIPYFRSEIMSPFGGTGEMLILQKRWYLLCLLKSRPRQRQKDCSFILVNRSASFINFKEAGPRNWL